MDRAEEVEQSRVVRLEGLGEDAEADGEEIDLDCEGVSALGGDEGLAELAEGGEDGGEGAGLVLFFAVVGGDEGDVGEAAGGQGGGGWER